MTTDAAPATSTAPATTLAAALTQHQGDWMRKALTVHGFTNKDMAAYLEVDAATVSRWINGKQPANKQTLRLWALRTGVPLSYLETGIIPDGDTPGEVDEKITKRSFASDHLAPVTPIRREVA